MTGDSPGIWIASVRAPDGKPCCELTVRGTVTHPPVADVRATAIDLVTCAAYAEMLMHLATALTLPASTASGFASDLLTRSGRTRFGTDTTLDLMPAGSTRTGEGRVLMRRPGQEQWEATLDPGEARDMALAWLEVAEATESDMLVAQALRATKACSEGQAATMFAYLRALRDRADTPGKPAVPAGTAAKLADTLAAIPGVPGAMVARARDGYYHDFLSPLPGPASQLISDLRDLARAPATPRNSRPLLHALADQVIVGDYDASKEEADAWAASPEGQEAMRMLSPGEPGA